MELNSKLDLKAGRILLSEPFMQDPNFSRSVILLCDHDNEDGSVGFVLNRPTQFMINEMMDDFPEFEARLYYGGPVAQDTLNFVHNVGDMLEDSLFVGNGIYWGGDFEKLKFLIENKLIKNHQLRFFIGYSGWSVGQLEEEIASGSWVVSHGDANYIFNSKPRNLWRKAMIHKGGSHAVLADIPDHQNSN